MLDNNILENMKIRKPSIRINTLKITKEEVKNILGKEGFLFEEVSWYSDALILQNKNEKDLEITELYQNGSVYLQSLSSMLPVLVLEPKENESILDMCAAPGSKTTQIGIMTQNKATITACEKNKIRKERLLYNLKKQGITCCTVLETDGRNLDSHFQFDKILLDAPCTGSGTNKIKNHPEMLEEKRFHKLLKTQEELFTKAYQLLKPNGVLVYSTCSILKEENEFLIQKMQEKYHFTLESISFNIPNHSIVPQTLCIYPDDKFEGFFIAKMIKK